VGRIKVGSSVGVKQGQNRLNLGNLRLAIAKTLLTNTFCVLYCIQGQTLGFGPNTKVNRMTATKKQNLNRVFIAKEGKYSDFGQTPELPIIAYETVKGAEEYIPVEVVSSGRVHWGRTDEVVFTAGSVFVEAGARCLSTEAVKPEGQMQDPLVLRGEGQSRIWRAVSESGEEVFTVEAGSLEKALELANAKKNKKWGGQLKLQRKPAVTIFGLTARSK